MASMGDPTVADSEVASLGDSVGGNSTGATSATTHMNAHMIDNASYEQIDTSKRQERGGWAGEAA